MNSNIKVVPATMEDYKALLTRDFPELEVKDIKYLGSGWGNAAILVNKDYVFRFPRGLFEPSEPLNSDVMKKEVQVLNYLQGKTSFSVPFPAFVAPEFRYFGYKLLEGTLWDHLGEAEQFSDSILESWVSIRTELSKLISPDKAAELGVKLYQYHTGKNERNVSKYITDPKANPAVKKMVEEAMQYVHQHIQDSTRVFIHEDLQMSNCFIDKTPPVITGVIDFEECEVGPIEADFYFWSKWGRQTLEKVAKLQEKYDGTKINVRLAEAIHQFYIVADYVDFTARGFTESADHKWRQIEAYL